MSKYNFNKIIDRRNMSSYKWDIKENELSLTIADMDFSVMPEITESINKIAKVSAYGYRYVPKEYFTSYVNHFTKRYGARFSEEDCIFSNGIVGSIDSILKRICKKGDGVAMLTPIYNVFFNCIKNNGLVLVDTPFIYENHKDTIDWELLEKNLKVAKAFIFCNPHNPIGKTFSEDEVKKIASLCEQNDVYLLSDEIHADFDYNGQKYVPVNKVSDYDKLISFYSPGKTFNLAGLHSSIVVIKEKSLRELLQKGIYEDDLGEANYFAIEPVMVAYNKGEQYIRELNEYLKNNRDLVRKSIKNPLYLIENDSTYLLWIDVSKVCSGEDFCKELREETGLVLLPGKIYGDDRFVRVNVATSEEVLKDALERLNKYLTKKV